VIFLNANGEEREQVIGAMRLNRVSGYKLEWMYDVIRNYYEKNFNAADLTISFPL
jgi:hypothetical protein